MSRARTLFGSACFGALIVVTAQAEYIDWDNLNLSGHFRLEPKLELCEETEISCDDPVYEGEITVHASRSAEGRLTSFEVRIDGRLLPLNIVDRYSSVDKFRVRDFQVRYPGRYVPEAVSKLVIGGEGPRILLFGLSYVDDECELQIRHVEIGYDLRRDKTDVYDWCEMP